MECKNGGTGQGEDDDNDDERRRGTRGEMRVAGNEGEGRRANRATNK